MNYDRHYLDESDADDEYGATHMTSPTLQGEYSPSESEATEHTPTSYARPKSYDAEGTIMRWSAEECAEFVSTLGLEQYADSFIDEEIDGEALVALQHMDLRDMGIASLGHRLTILKGVYNEKISQQVPIEPDHYVPLSADANAPDAHATQDDVARIINQIKLRDERIMTAEAELRALREDVWRLQEDQRKIREETLPVIRMVKDQKAPLPTPDTLEERGNPLSPVEPATANKPTLSRKFSKKGLYLGGAGKSPTMKDGGDLNPSAAALAASNHLTASMSSSGGQSSPSQTGQPSPTSPPVQSQYSSQPRPFWQQQQAKQSPVADTQDSAPQSGGRSNAPQIPRRAVPAINTSTPPSASASAPPNSTVSTVPPSSAISGPPQATQGGQSGMDDASGFMKSFRVGMEEPCFKVLPQALKKYNIADDWRQYSLYIVHGDQERCLGLEERPLILFKQLANEGKKPMFMLRKHAAPLHGHEQQATRASYTPSVSLPGGVL